MYTMNKPAWFGRVGGATVVSPASVVMVGDWWDAWRLMWMAIGVVRDHEVVLHARIAD